MDSFILLFFANGKQTEAAKDDHDFWGRKLVSLTTDLANLLYLLCGVLGAIMFVEIGDISPSTINGISLKFMG